MVFGLKNINNGYKNKIIMNNLKDVIKTTKQRRLLTSRMNSYFYNKQMTYDSQYSLKYIEKEIESIKEKIKEIKGKRLVLVEKKEKIDFNLFEIDYFLPCNNITNSALFLDKNNYNDLIEHILYILEHDLYNFEKMRSEIVNNRVLLKTERAMTIFALTFFGFIDKIVNKIKKIIKYVDKTSR